MSEENSQVQENNQVQEEQEAKSEAKFTQDDLNKLLQERLATEKSKHQKELETLKEKIQRENELSKMNENDRIKAELEDLKAKNQKYEDEIALNNQTAETRKLMQEAKLPDTFLKFVLVPKNEVQTKSNIHELKSIFEAEIKKGVEEQIKPHKPIQPTVSNKKVDDGPTYSGFNLQNSIAEYYNKN